MNKDPALASRFSQRIPPGEDRERSVCDHCGFIDYQNPKIVVGSVATWEDKILLCRRAIEPRLGYWTLPAGYLELNESVAAGALREAYEEARADIAIDRVLAIYSIERISQIQIMFTARLKSPKIAPGPESQAVALYRWEDIPWPEMAFPSASWALRQWRESRHLGDFAPFGNPADGS